MDFRFTDDQRLLAEALRDLLAGSCTPEDVRVAWEEGPSRERWRALARMGVVGVAAPVEHGGGGLGDLELCLLLEEAGRAGLPEPLLETAAVVVPLLASVGGERAGAWLPRLCAGEVLATVSLPGQPFVAHATHADVVFLAGDDDVRVAATQDARPVLQESVDPSRQLATLDRSRGDMVASGVAGAVADAAERAAFGAAAMLLGLGRRLVEEAAGYAREREQFGRPIGSFQAIKHLLADALVDLEFSAPVVYRAAYAVAHGEPDRTRDVSMAKVFAGEAAARAARTALQVHGAIGYTWEHDLQLWMKRVWALNAAYGTPDDHRSRVEEFLLG